MGLVRENLVKSQRCHSEFDYYMLLLQVMHVIIAGSLLITDMLLCSGPVMWSFSKLWTLIGLVLD